MTYDHAEEMQICEITNKEVLQQNKVIKRYNDTKRLNYTLSITTINVIIKSFPLIYISLIMIINYLNNINFIVSHTILVMFSQYHKHYQYDKN